MLFPLHLAGCFSPRFSLINVSSSGWSARPAGGPRWSFPCLILHQVHLDSHLNSPVSFFPSAPTSPFSHAAPLLPPLGFPTLPLPHSTFHTGLLEALPQLPLVSQTGQRKPRHLCWGAAPWAFPQPPWYLVVSLFRTSGLNRFLWLHLFT